MQFFKYEALGNDYIVLDPRAVPAVPSEAVIRRICDRNRGLGSDGILYGPVVQEGRFSVRIFNPDGSEAGKSGNGLRIFARYLYEHGYAKPEVIEMATVAGPAKAEVLDADEGVIRIDMGDYSFWSSDIPVAGPPREVVDESIFVRGESFRVTCVGIGNPHCVLFPQEVSSAEVQRVGPWLTDFELFPEKINVQLVRPVNPARIAIEIFERGAGYTLASGSSSCAAAAAAHRRGLVGPSLTVMMPGGELRVELGPGQRASLTGQALPVAEGEIASSLVRSE